MVRAYSEDLRIRVIRTVEDEEESARAAGRRYGVSESAAIKWAMSLSLLKFVGQASLVDEAMLPS